MRTRALEIAAITVIEIPATVAGVSELFDESGRLLGL